MIVFGADLSLTNSGYAVGVDGRIMDHGLIPGKGTGMERLIWNRNRVCEKIESARPGLVVFEDFSFGSNMAFAREIAGMAYMIRAELVADKIPYCCISPLAVKKYAVGSAGTPKAKVGKELILKWVDKRWGHDVSDNNIADGLVLTHLGMALCGEEETTMDAQREVLAKVRESFPWLKDFVHAVQIPAGQPEESW